MDRRTLKKLIISNKLIDSKRLNELEALAINSSASLLDTIINGKYISESVLMPIVSKSLGLDWTEIKPDDEKIEPSLFNALPNDLKEEQDIVPLYKENDQVVIAISNPLKIELTDKLHLVTGWDISLKLITKFRIEKIKEYIQTLSPEIQDIADELSLDDLNEKSLEDIANEAPVIKRVNLIIMQAISIGASDIHIDPYEHEAIVRYRIDGILKESGRYPKNLYPALISRIKIMSDLNIAERRIPQDGRISINLMDKSYDLRVATIPVLHGEGIVLRILDKSGSLVSLSGIGLNKANLASFKRQISLPYGIILVTGPTGSGKTTTLNAALSSIKDSEKKIITIEDPVEYEVPGITQIHVNAKVGLTFATGLRSILRLDPDIVMVGEIRDLETAEIAIRTALTGHLVFSTLHTNDAISAITRLIDMGIEPFLISSSVNALMAQRLVRRICKKCSVERDPTPAAINLFESANIKLPKKLLYGKGCDACSNTGYKGRISIIEFAELDSKLRELTNQKVSTDILKEEAVKSGMVTMREDGINKIIKKITTAEEVIRVTQLD
jgi:type II secretory ATPase GspE/PulE/Tfp pilus assembly ATPase PilB-like protein